MHTYADRVAIRQGDRILAQRAGCRDRPETVYDPWHYVPVLSRKQRTLRSGARFED
jgi:hypothetical protein